MSVAVENGPLPLDQRGQSGGGVREILHAIAFAPQPYQQVVKRRYDLHAGGCQGILPRSLVVVDRHALLAVGLALQGDVAVHRLDEPLPPFGNGMDLLQPFAVETVAEERLGPDRPVDFGHHDALRQETAVHAHLVGLPLADRPVDVERREERDVPPGQVLHDGIAQTPVRHVDHGRRTDRIGLSVPDRRLQVAEGVDHVAGLFQPGNQLGGFAHLSRYDHPRGILFQQAVPRQKGLVGLHAVEIRLFRLGIRGVGMVELFQVAHHGRLGLVRVKPLAVDRAAKAGEQVAVVLPAAAVEVALDGRQRRGVRRNDLVRRIGYHGRDDGEPPIGGPLENLPLFGRDAEPHAVHQHHVVAPQTVEVRRGELREADAAVIVGPGDLSERRGLVIYKGDACGREPAVPRHNAQYDSKQDYACPYSYSMFHD